MVLCASLLVICAAAASAQTFYVTDLGPCSDSSVDAVDRVSINGQGQVAFTSLSQGVASAMLYTPGSGVANLGGQGVGLQPGSLGLNDNGDLVGQGYVGGSYQAVVYQNSTQSWSAIGSTGMAYGYAINDSGVIAGANGSNVGITATNYGAGTVTTLGAQDAYGVNSGGTVVGGNPDYLNNQAYAWYWQNGQNGGAVQYVTNVPRSTADGVFYAVNDSGVIVGQESGGTPEPWIYSGGNWTAIRDPNGNGAAHGTRGNGAYGIASDGDIVGDLSFKVTTFTYSQGVFLYTASNGLVVNLNNVLDPLSSTGWNFALKSGAEASGIAVVDYPGHVGEDWIVGHAIGPDGNSDAFLLTPTPLAVPEPSALLLAAAGAVGLLAYAWRRRR
jgi:hypothetical protein